MNIMASHHVVAIITSLLGLLNIGYCSETTWGYGPNDGPSTWAEEFPEFCAGDKQSPIDIKAGEAVVREWTALTFTGFDSTTSTTLENNGHTAVVTLTADYFISGGDLPSEYKAVQFHFHWGDEDTVGSEHQLDGKQYSAEMHIVAYDHKKYNSSTVAINEPEGLAVIGVFIEVGGSDNAAFKTLTDALDNVVAKETSHTFTTMFSIEAMLPVNRDVFYRYDGSLTTPTCNEVVVWTVLKNTVRISEAQIAKFRDLEFSAGDPMVNNFRPPQAFGTRTLYVRDPSKDPSSASILVISIATMAMSLISSYFLI
ncbi:carbonic anhydrase 7-like [Glandiceps talaboti]